MHSYLMHSYTHAYLAGDDCVQNFELSLIITRSNTMCVDTVATNIVQSGWVAATADHL